MGNKMEALKALAAVPEQFAAMTDVEIAQALEDGAKEAQDSNDMEAIVGAELFKSAAERLRRAGGGAVKKE